LSNVTSIFPANDFNQVLDNAKDEIECGIIIGYDENGNLTVYGGGLLDGAQPLTKDWLWMVAAFQNKLLNGDYSQ
tara:strand:- start:4235 stop:4459 length:225 start_codon:yes stop_codon:yes gene_type:complete